METITRRSVLRGSAALAATGALARPHIANAAAMTATVWWNQGFIQSEDIAFQNLAAAYRAGVTLAAGTDSGNPLVVHGPSVHRELQLWVEAGIPPAAALQGATYNAAKLLRADQRIGLIRKGYEANLLLVDGNPVQDISATERISTVFFKGERVNRPDLFEQK